MNFSTQSLVRRLTVRALLAAVAAAPATAWACPMCKDAVGGDPVATALSATTLLLIVIPASLFLSIGGWIGFAYWRAARHAATMPDTAEPMVLEPPV
jgi:hypothetical protein